eukprot:c20409_g1_i1 orf=604-1575(-)
MESLRLSNVQLPSAHHTLPLNKLPSTRIASFLSTTNRHSGHTILLSKQQHNLVFPKERSSRIGNVRCCAPAQSLLNESLSDSSLKKGDLKFHDEHTLLLKNKASDIVSDLKGTCIYLVGMMGSGKTTVGKVLAEALEYNFIDSDKVLEEAAGGVTVAQLFKQQDEESFRDAETEVLKNLSCNGQLVIATGGGIVIRPVNWSYLRYGVTVWLDVPLESLAERVVAVGMSSRPLLGRDSKGDSPYSQALHRLTSIYEERASYYANADATVCLQELALSLGYHVRDLTPTIIAYQALEEINKLIIRKKLEGNVIRHEKREGNGNYF